MSPTAAAGGVVSAGESVTTPAPSTTSADITTYERLINTIGKSNINEECGIREVWASNMEEEFKQICHTVQKFPFVAMDTEFPGVVARPIGDFKSTADYQYQLLRCNVDLLKIIQLGLTFLDEKGNMPAGITTWQFNFKFNLTEDMYAEDSVDLLQNSGIRFEKHERDGIETIHFAEMLLVSGVVLMDNVRFLSFHSGSDFGYLLRLLTSQNLPQEESEFFELLKLYFPNVYDVKYLMKSCKNLKGGLQEVADLLEVERIGPQHQAGSDSLLTGLTFFKMTEMFFEDAIDDTKYCGHLFGLGTNYVVTTTSQEKTTTTMTTTQTSTESTDDERD
jgi:CCR4-NOT transcription complex subunit 7/8